MNHFGYTSKSSSIQQKTPTKLISPAPKMLTNMQQNIFNVLFIILISIVVISAQKIPWRDHKPDNVAAERYDADLYQNRPLSMEHNFNDNENFMSTANMEPRLNKLEAQLIKLLENYQNDAPIPRKFAEKRRNKFEFIRFGRR